eukprot:6488524-Amphidinium_carterae.1
MMGSSFVPELTLLDSRYHKQGNMTTKWCGRHKGGNVTMASNIFLNTDHYSCWCHHVQAKQNKELQMPEPANNAENRGMICDLWRLLQARVANSTLQACQKEREDRGM